MEQLTKVSRLAGIILAFMLLLGMLPATALAEPAAESNPGSSLEQGTETETVPEAENAITPSDEAEATDETLIPIDAANFPDANFLAVVSDFDSDGDGMLSAAEISSVAVIDCWDGVITSLQGIEHFTALTELYCSHNQLTSLDVSGNTALTKLDCSYNQLTSLDVSSNTALTLLNGSYNQLTALDVSSHTALTELNCCGNALSSLDVSGSAALTKLDCSENQLTALDVSSNTALTELICYSNALSSLDVSSNTALTLLNCSRNQLTALDVSSNTALTSLFCTDNQLTSLDVSNVPVIKDAYINGRKDTDVSTCIVYVTSQGKLGVDCGASILAGTADTLPADDSKDGEDDPANGADADEKDHTAPHTDDISYAGLWIGLMGVGILSLIVPALTGKRSARKTTGERFHD